MNKNINDHINIINYCKQYIKTKDIKRNNLITYHMKSYGNEYLWYNNDKLVYIAIVIIKHLIVYL